jgi:hypothetical protein
MYSSRASVSDASTAAMVCSVTMLFKFVPVMKKRTTVWTAVAIGLQIALSTLVPFGPAVRRRAAVAPSFPVAAVVRVVHPQTGVSGKIGFVFAGIYLASLKIVLIEGDTACAACAAGATTSPPCATISNNGSVISEGIIEYIY